VSNQSRPQRKRLLGKNPFKHGVEASIPYVVTHDGRTIRYPDPVIKSNDTVKVDLKTNKIIGHLKFEVGNICTVTRGANIGRIGVLVHTDKHPGSFDIVHLRDRRGATFATRLHNVFVIGEGKKAWISLPRGKGVKTTIIEERDKRMGGKKGERKEDKDDEDKRVERPTPQAAPAEAEKEKGKGDQSKKQRKEKGGKGDKGGKGGKGEKGGKGGKGGGKKETPQ